MGRSKVASIGTLVLVVALLMGCSLLDGGDTKESRRAELARAEMEAAVADQKAADTAAGKTLPEDLDISGSWSGTLSFDDYTMLLDSEEAVEAWEPGVKSTLDRPYPITVSIRSTADGKSGATFTLDDKTVIEGTVAREGNRVNLLFRKAGSTELEVGASPPVIFEFEGFIETDPSPKLSGQIRYDVLTQTGANAWVQTGYWEAMR